MDIRRYWGQTCPQCKSGTIEVTYDWRFICLRCHWSPLGGESDRRPPAQKPSQRRPKRSR